MIPIFPGRHPAREEPGRAEGRVRDDRDRGGTDLAAELGPHYQALGDAMRAVLILALGAATIAHSLAGAGHIEHLTLTSEFWKVHSDKSLPTHERLNRLKKIVECEKAIPNFDWPWRAFRSANDLCPP